MRDYWQRQASGTGTPLFPDMLWSRPENKQFAGKLLIVGGNAHGFAAPAEAYAAAEQAGIGTARVLLPDSLRQVLQSSHPKYGTIFETGEFAPSTPSGSFSQKALAELLSLAGWADGVLLDGDMGRNSETAIMLEKFTAKHAGQLTLSNESADYFLSMPQTVLARPDTLLALNFSQTQKLFISARFPQALTSNMGLAPLAEALHTFTTQHTAFLILEYEATVFVAAKGRISSTKPENVNERRSRSPGRIAAGAAVWWLQNPGKPFEALTTSLTLP